MKERRQFFSGTMKAPFGPVTVIAGENGIHNVLFNHEEAPHSLLNDNVTPRPEHDVVAMAIGQLTDYFSGIRTTFDLPLDLEGTPFQISAWRALATVPFGRTASYAQQAARIGRPTATRAIGAANGKNPVAIVLPCHRIVGADGSLTGFAGGLDVKRWLLDHEQKVLARRSSQ